MKVVLITGSTSGIGLGIAKEFAKSGYAIAFNGLEENGAEIAQEVGNTYGVKTHFYGADLRNAEQIYQMIDDVEAHFSCIDVLVNNAGIQFVSPIEDFPVEKWNAIMDINLNMPMLIIKIILANMIKNNYGKIINFTSQVIKKTHTAASPSYEVSKAGISSLNRYLAKNFSKYNINFNTIMPGTIKSNMQKTMSKKNLENIKIKIPQKRLGSPEEVAELVFFLCSERASYINGASINISGASLLD